MESNSESLLVGCLLVDAGRCYEVRRIVDGSDFADADLGAFFDLICRLADAGGPVSDLGWLVPKIQETREFRVLGLVCIVSMANSVVNVAHAVYYAESIRQNSQQRRIRDLGERLAQCQGNPSDAAAEAIAALVGIYEATSSRDTFQAHECVASVLNRIDEVSRGGSPGLETGIRCIDAIAGTMQRGEMIVLAARTSVGKSALALDIATHNARNGNRVLYFSLEMMEHSVGTRFASRETGLDSESIESGILNPSQRRAIEDAKDLISGWPLTVVTQSSLSVGQIGAYSRAHAARHGLDLIIIDHAGLVKSLERSAYERATEIATDIQRLAMAVKVPVLACYQINRAGEGQMPTLADLRDSGAIEENAHKIWLLHRERGKAESFFRVAKYRNGQVGDVADGLLVFDPSRASYRDAFHAFASDFQ